MGQDEAAPAFITQFMTVDISINFMVLTVQEVNPQAVRVGELYISELIEFMTTNEWLYVGQDHNTKAVGVWFSLSPHGNERVF